MGETWQIGRRTRTCAQTGEPIPAGTPFFSALIEGEDSFERRDYSLAAWPDVDTHPFFSYWKNKAGEAREEKKRAVDYERLLAFYDGLEDADDPRKRLFRYVLALILARRRKLRLDGMERTEEGDRIVVYDRRSEKTAEITAPEASKEELEAVQEKLNELFEADVSL